MAASNLLLSRRKSDFSDAKSIYYASFPLHFSYHLIITKLILDDKSLIYDWITYYNINMFLLHIHRQISDLLLLFLMLLQNNLVMDMEYVKNHILQHVSNTSCSPVSLYNHIDDLHILLPYLGNSNKLHYLLDWNNSMLCISNKIFLALLISILDLHDKFNTITFNIDNIEEVIMEPINIQYINLAEGVLLLNPNSIFI